MKPINIISKLNEEDHEKKPEDYTNASYLFRDTFLNGDYIRSSKGYSMVHIIQDDGSHVIKPKDTDNEMYNAYSKDGIDWQIALGRTPKYTKEGKPIDIAKYLIKLNDNK